MGHLTSTATTTGLRCPVHHVPTADCPPLDGDLVDTLADLHTAGIPIHIVAPQLLDLCEAFDGCTEQAEVLIRTTGRERRNATFTSWQLACPGCLWRAVSADLRSHYEVSVHVPSHTAGAVA